MLLKDKHGVKNEILILWDFTEKSDFYGGGGGHKKPVYRYIGGIFYKEGTVESL